jgi:hypothetical protein
MREIGALAALWKEIIMIRARIRSLALLSSISIFLVMPRAAFAQKPNGWQVDLAPLYFWAATTSGNLAINGTKDIPVYLSFGDAKSSLAKAFTFHGEAKKGQWGILGDVYFIGLSSDVSYTAPIIGLPISGTLELDQVITNGKGTYEVKPGTRFYIVGGVRTMNLSPKVHFTGPVGGQLADFGGGNTKVAGVGGFIYRPKLNDRFTVLTQADIGDGGAFTWSAFGGIEFRIKRWIGVAGGYEALAIDMGDVPTSGSARVGTLPGDVKYSMKQYGPVFSLTFHIGQ